MMNEPKNVSVLGLQGMKAKGERVVCLTALESQSLAKPVPERIVLRQD
jgi:hypothetical protein